MQSSDRTYVPLIWVRKSASAALIINRTIKVKSVQRPIVQVPRTPATEIQGISLFVNQFPLQYIRGYPQF